jgi:hypothetical protein
MRSQILPAEHVFALGVNALVLAIVFSSLVLLMPRFLAQSARLALIRREVRVLHARVEGLEAEGRQVPVLTRQVARSQANLIPGSRVSIVLER